MHSWRHTQNPIRNNWKCVRIGKQNELWRCEELYCIGIDAISTVTQVEENNMSRSPSNNSPKSLGGPKGSGVRSQFQVNPCISHAILNLKKNLSSLAFGFFHKKSLWFYYILVPRHQIWSNSIAVCVSFFANISIKLRPFVTCGRLKLKTIHVLLHHTDVTCL